MRVFFSVFLFLSLSLVGCTSKTICAVPPKKETLSIEQHLNKNKPTIVGIITSVDATMIRVEGDPHEHYGSYKGDLYIKKETEYWIRDGKTYRRGKKEDLYRGMKVEVWVDGLIAESVPFQAGNKYIVASAKYIVYDAKELVDDQQKVYTKPDLVGKIAKIEKERYLEKWGSARGL